MGQFLLPVFYLFEIRETLLHVWNQWGDIYGTEHGKQIMDMIPDFPR